MNVAENIKKIRMAKGLSQKEVTISSGLDTAQYSRIENGKTDPSVTTLERIAKAMNISLAEIFSVTEEMREVNSYNQTIWEKINLVETLPEDERKTIYIMLDAFVGKKKLKDTLANVLQDVN